MKSLARRSLWMAASRSSVRARPACHGSTRSSGPCGLCDCLPAATAMVVPRRMGSRLSARKKACALYRHYTRCWTADQRMVYTMEHPFRENRCLPRPGPGLGQTGAGMTLHLGPTGNFHRMRCRTMPPTSLTRYGIIGLRCRISGRWLGPRLAPGRAVRIPRRKKKTEFSLARGKLAL